MNSKTEQDEMTEWIFAIIDEHFPLVQTQMELNKKPTTRLQAFRPIPHF